MQFAVLIVVLAAVASAEAGGRPLSGLVWRLPIIAAALLAAPISALVAAHRLSATTYQSDRAEQAIFRWQNVITAVWVGSMAFVLLAAGWPQLVRDNWRLGKVPLIDEMLILTPAVGSLLAVWALFYQMERGFELSAFRACGMAPPPARLLPHLALEARHHLGMILLPTLLIVGASETMAVIKPQALSAETAAWFVAPLLATSLVCMPLLLRRLWRTTPLPCGELRSELESICRERRSPVREILVWQTDFTQANAAVVGISRYLRYVLLSDALLRRLTTDQIAAVLRHELAHLRRWHLPLRLALLLAPVALWLAIAKPANDWITTVTGTLGTFILPLLFLGYAAVVVGWYSRLLEHDADLDACLDARGNLCRSEFVSFSSALLTLCGRSTANRWLEWTHPSIPSRIGFLEKGSQSPAFVARFRRKLLAITAVIVAIYLLAAAIACSSLLAS